MQARRVPQRAAHVPGVSRLRIEKDYDERKQRGPHAARMRPASVIGALYGSLIPSQEPFSKLQTGKPMRSLPVATLALIFDAEVVVVVRRYV